MLATHLTVLLVLSAWVPHIATSLGNLYHPNIREVSLSRIIEAIETNAIGANSNAAPPSVEGVSSTLASLVVRYYDAVNCSSENPFGEEGIILTSHGCIDANGLNLKIFACEQEESSVNLLFNLYADDDCSSDSFVTSSTVRLDDTSCIEASPTDPFATEVVCSVSDVPWINGTEGLAVLGYECQGCHQHSSNGPLTFFTLTETEIDCRLSTSGLYIKTHCSDNTYRQQYYVDDACTTPADEVTLSLDCGGKEEYNVEDNNEVDDDYYSLFIQPNSFIGYCSASEVPALGLGRVEECPLERDDDFCFHTNTVITYKGVEYSYEDLLSGKEVECSIPHTVVSRGVIIRTACNKTVRVTDTHLMATPRGYQAAFSLKAGDVLHGGWGGTDDDDSSECVVVSVEKEQSTQQYFGLNCAESVVLASGLRASTFGDFHALPSWYMKYVGNLQVVGMKGVVNMLGECMSGWYFSI